MKIKYFEALKELILEGHGLVLEYFTYREIAYKLAVREGLPVLYETVIEAGIAREVNRGAENFERMEFYELCGE